MPIRFPLLALLFAAGLAAAEPVPPAPSGDQQAAWLVVRDAPATLDDRQRRDVLMALADLALCGDPAMHGLDPGWTTQARELRKKHQPTAGSPLPDRVAEWWWLAIEGHTAAVVAEVDAMPAAQQAPQLRWLRQWCTRDWRKRPATDEPPFAWLAWMRAAGSEHGEMLLNAGHVPAAVWNSSLGIAIRQDGGGFPSEESRLRLSDALAQARRLAREDGLPAAALAPAHDLLALQDDDGRAVVAALALTAALPQDGSSGRRAAALQRLLQSAAFDRFAFLAWQLSDPGSVAVLADPIVAGVPESLLGIIMSQPTGVDRKRYLTALARVQQDAAEPLVVHAVKQAKNWKLAGADEATRRYSEQWSATRRLDGSWLSFAGIRYLLQTLDDKACPPPVEAAIAADPWEPDLMRRVSSKEQRRQLAQRLRQDEPWRLSSMLYVGTRLHDGGDKALGMGLLDLIAATEPGHPSLLTRCDLLFALGRKPEAIDACRNFLKHNRTFDRIYVGTLLGKLLEEAKDLPGAEAAFKDAAESWQGDAMDLYAEFLMRQQRWAEALSWWKKAIGRYDSDRAMVAAAECLLRLDPPQVDEAVQMLNARQAQARHGANSKHLASALRELIAAGGGDVAYRVARSLAHFNDGELRHLRAWGGMDCGHLLAAEADLDWLADDIYPVSTWTPAEAAEIVVRATLAAGLWGRTAAIHKDMRLYAMKQPGAAGPALAWLAGTLGEAEARPIADGAEGGLLRLTWAWCALAHQDRAGAIAWLEPLAARADCRPYAGSARLLLKTLRGEAPPDLVRLAALSGRSIPLPKPPKP